MIKNYYWAMAVMAAFVAGTMTTGTIVNADKPTEEAGGPMSQIKTFDFTGVQTIDVSSTGPFIMIACATNSLGTTNDSMSVSNSINLIGFIDIELSDEETNCFTQGAEANDSLEVSVSQNDGFTNGRISVQTTQGAIVTFTP